MNNFNIELPIIDKKINQQEEYFILKGEEDEKIQFHDYERIYRIPGLYEELFHNRLKCQSPEVIKELLYKNVQQSESNFNELRILDYGAGNGLVAEALNQEKPNLIVGIDIFEEAKAAAIRDRGNIYKDYFVENLSEPTESVIQKLKSYNLNTIVAVSALGLNHIPPDSFINAFNLIENTGWIAINLIDRFFTKEDETGLKKTLNWMEGDCIEFLDEKTYVHRLSVTGKPINYTAIVGRKLNDI